MNIGTVEIITFRTTREDHPYWYPLTALFYGMSTGHVALRFKINDSELYYKYIHDNPSIPHRTIDGTHEIYVSFWPHNEHSKLETHRYDCEQSAGYSPFIYDKRFLQYLKPPVRIVNSYLPYLNKITAQAITLPPAIVLHTSRLRAAKGDKVARFVELYTVVYSLWRRAVIAESNASIFELDTIKLHKNTLLSQYILLILEKILNKILPNTDEFITYGNTERDLVRLPILSHQLEPMLKFIKKLANNPHEFPYTVFNINCAHISLQVLRKGFGTSFSISSLLRSFGLTLTPTYLLQEAATESAIDKLAVSPGDSMPYRAMTPP